MNITQSECVCICSLSYPACNAHAPYCHLWSVPLDNICPHYLTNGTIFGKKKLLTQNVCFDFLYISHPQKKLARYDQKMYLCLHVQYPLILFDFNVTWIFQTYFLKILKYQISFKSVQWEQSCSMRTDGQTDKHDKANSRFRNFTHKPK